MRVDVYPTHRTAALPKRVLDNTAKNAVNAKTNNNGLALENALAGEPFPIPKTGSEAMWNHLMRWTGRHVLQVRQLERRHGRRSDAVHDWRNLPGVSDLRR